MPITKTKETEENKEKFEKRKEDVIKQEKNMRLGSEKVKLREQRIRHIKAGLLIILLFLIIIYFLLKIAYDSGNFTISLDENFALKSGLIMYERLNEKDDKRQLSATRADFIDNISVNWLPSDLDSQGEGSHNGDNYFAYTFYIENKGSEVVNYWYEILVDDVIKNVDRAVRVMVIRNGEKTIYARANERTGEAEVGTTKFFSPQEVCVEGRQDFKPGDIDKFTIVIFIEGDDPDCVDALIGGEMKMHMEITEEHISQE